MHLEQHKLKQVFHPSTKVKSQPSFFPGNTWRSPQFILDVLGRAFPGGWLGARVLPVVSRTDLQTWTQVLLPTLCHPTMCQLPAFLASPGLVACIPWKSHSLGCRSNPQCTKNMKMREEQIQLLPGSTDFLRDPQARPSLQILDSKSQLHRDQLGSLPPGSPGHTEGLRVDIQAWQDGLEGCGFWLKPAMCLACQIYASPIGFPAHTAMECTRDVHSCPICSAQRVLSQPKGCLHLSPAVSAVGMFMAGVNLPKPHCRAQKNKLLSSFFLSEH